MKKILSNAWNEFDSVVKEDPKGPVIRPFRWIVVPLVILGVSTWLIRISGFDMAAQEAIYRAGQGSWEFGDRSLWLILYEYGTIPAALVCLAALVGFVASLFKEQIRSWRQCFLFILLLGVIGPGVVTNLILKEYWGRPRPREVVGIGGQQNFEPVLVIDKSSSGKSFPCGHATMGYFFVGGFFLFRRYRRSWAWFFLIFGLTLGFFMGVARMCKGGHFFSDVIWSGAIIYFISLILYFDLKLHRGLIQPSKGKPMPLWMKIGVPVCGVALLAGVLLATPYRNVRHYKLVQEHSQIQPLEVHLILKIGTISIVPGSEFSIGGEAWGHGVPTSKVAVHFVEIDQGSHSQVVYKERISGKFTEVDQSLKITLPWDRVRGLRISSDDSKVAVQLPEEIPAEPIWVMIPDGKGDIELKNLPENFDWEDSGDRERFGKPGDVVNSQESRLRIRVGEAFEGNLVIDP